IACDNKPSKNGAQELVLEEIKQDSTTQPPELPPPPPKDSAPHTIKIEKGVTKCFVSEGLKYKTTVTLVFNNNEALGIVRNEELQSGKQRSTAIAGTRSGNEFAVSFIRGEPPVTDGASEWTNKKWILKKVNG